MDTLLISPDEVARLLGVGRTYVYEELLGKGRLESVKLGRRRLIPRSALDEFVALERESQARSA